ncbi:MAG TPA: hypothetical protein IAB17_05575 [Candidatus Alectryocaccobium stercorigallinarum]|nr:hypothetical protein [Candidatus Alectryocaccobium stercorigallinarum]
MGQIANEALVELIVHIKDKIKEKREEKKENDVVIKKGSASHEDNTES